VLLYVAHIYTTEYKSVETGNHLFLIDNPLSWTSMFYRLLAYHPDLAWFSQWSLRNSKISGRTYIPLVNFLDKYGRCVDLPWSKVTSMKGLNWFIYRIIPSPSDGGNIWDWIFPVLKQKTPYERDQNVASGVLPTCGHDSIHEIKKRLYFVLGKILRDQGKSRILAKRPILIYVMPIIAQLLPNTKFVHIIRDPRAFCLSSLKKGPILEYFENIHDAVCMFANYWLNTIKFLEQCQDKIGRDKVITLRYEDMIEDIPSTLEQIYSFADLTSSHLITKKIPDKIFNTNNLYFRKANSKHIKLIEDITGNYLVKYGYKPWTERSK